MGDVMGYLADGHHDQRQFAIQCNKEFDLAPTGCPVHMRDVEHIYYIKKPVDDQTWEMVEVSPQTEGAIAATWVQT